MSTMLSDKPVKDDKQVTWFDYGCTLMIFDQYFDARYAELVDMFESCVLSLDYVEMASQIGFAQETVGLVPGVQDEEANSSSWRLGLDTTLGSVLY